MMMVMVMMMMMLRTLVMALSKSRGLIQLMVVGLLTYMTRGDGNDRFVTV